jgi:hypothetical protein
MAGLAPHLRAKPWSVPRGLEVRVRILIRTALVDLADIASHPLVIVRLRASWPSALIRTCGAGREGADGTSGSKYRGTAP